MADKDALEIMKLPHERGADFVHVYSNSAQISSGFYDMNILFCLISPSTGENAVVKDRAMVSMSLEHAKALLKILRGTIEQYEKQNGPIRVKPAGAESPAESPGELIQEKQPH